MRKYIGLIAIIFITLASQAQRSAVLPDITALKAFTGLAEEVFVLDVNTGGKFITSAEINEETADEFDIYAGAGGRKWKRVANIGPKDTLFLERPLYVAPRGPGSRIDSLRIKTDSAIYQPSSIAGMIDEGTNVTITGTGTTGDPFVISATGGGESGVASFNSRTGAVSPATDDYTWAQINKTTSSLADITTRSAGDLSSGTLPDARLSSNVVTLTGTQTLTNKTLTTPLIAQINGGTAAGSGIILRATTGNANTSSFIDFQTGNNGALRAMRINNAGTVHLGAGTPAANDILYVGKTTGYDPIGAFETTVSDGFTMFGLRAPSSIWHFGTASTTSVYQNLGGKYFVYDKTNELAAMVIDRSGYKVGVGGITQPTAFLHTAASTTSYAAVRMPHGSAPSSPNNGDFWTTTAGAYARINGVTRQLDNGSDNLTSGTYTPTFSNESNVTSVTSVYFTYTRQGNRVTVDGTFTLTVTANSTFSRVNISLPIASDITTNITGNGAAAAQNGSLYVNAPIVVYPDSSGDTARCEWASSANDASGVRQVNIHFVYEVANP